VGLCSFAPKKFGQFGVTFKFNTIGKATIYLDNILIKNMKGEVVEEIFMDKFNQSAFKSPNTSIVNL